MEKEDKMIYGVIAQLISEGAEIAEDKGLSELSDMLSRAFDLMEQEKDPEKRFFNCYQFAHRVYFRIKNMNENDTKSIPINRLSKEGFNYRITNYDYKTFLWAKNRGFGDAIDNLCIVVPDDKLNQAEKARFDKILNA